MLNILAIKEMQIKTTLRLHLTLLEYYCEEHQQQQMLAKMQEKGTLIHCWWECKLAQSLQKTVWRLLKKTNSRTAI
jgi:hypothetical protein